MPGACAGVDHAGDRVVPGVLLGADAGRLGVVGVGVLDRAVARVASADAGGLHPPGGGQVRGPEAHSLHPGAGGRDLLQVRDALRRLEDRVDEQRLCQAGLGFELGEQAVDVVDVPRALDLRDHDHVELVADLGHELGQVIEHPGALERVDAGPQLCVAEVRLLGDLDQSLAGRDLLLDRNGVLEVAEQDVGLLRHIGDLRRHLLVRGVEEVDHPGGAEGDLAQGLGRVEGQRFEEVAGVSH